MRNDVVIIGCSGLLAGAIARELAMRRPVAELVIMPEKPKAPEPLELTLRNLDCASSGNTFQIIIEKPARGGQFKHGWMKDR